jgi:hypothetical protein
MRRIALLVSLGLLAPIHACQEAPELSEPIGEPAAASVAPGVLVVAGTGTGDGTVTSSPSGINCTIVSGAATGSGCTANFGSSATVTLTAIPKSGHAFNKWIGACTGSGTCQVALSAGGNVTARFMKGPFTVKVAGGGSGTGSGTVRSQSGLSPAINCTITNGTAGATGCQVKYPANTPLVLTAEPAQGQSFIGWGETCTGTGTCDVPVTQFRDVIAAFGAAQAEQYSLTVQGSGAGTGTVTSQQGLSPAINCEITGGQAADSACSASYPPGTVVTLSADPAANSSFTGWTGACTGTGTCQVTLSQARTVTAGFSVSGSSPLATIGRWEPLFSTPVIALHMHMLKTGKVLMWGLTGQAALWNPENGNFTTLNKPYELFCSGHTILPDGRLLVSGGHIANDRGLPNAAIYDPTHNSWTTIASMARGRWYPSVSTLPNGDIVTISGADQAGEFVPTPELWNGSQWLPLTGATLSLAYYPRMFVAPNGRLFLAGPMAKTRYLNPSGTGQWTTVATRNVASRNYGSAVMYAPGKILYTGGGIPPVNSTEAINLNQASPSWRVMAPMAFARRHHNATLLANGKVLVTHGTSGDGFNNAAAGVREAELWDPDTDTWTTMARESSIRVYHSTALLLPDGRVLSSGSGNGSGSPNNFTAQVFTPPYLFDPDGGLAARPRISSAPATLFYGQHFEVESPDAESVARGTLIPLSSVTHAMNTTQRLYPLSLTHQGSTTLGATAPSSANVAPPGPYMLFLLNDRGVPSEARILMVGN